jgi:chromate transporter
VDPDSIDAPVWTVVGPLFAHFVVLSLMAIGGGVVMLAPEIQRFVVESHHWVTAEQFSASYAIAQAAPGPNMLYVTLVGWQAAGWAGAAAATIAIVTPPSLLTLAVMRFTTRRAPGPLGRAVGKGLAPISVGLLFATGWILLFGVSGGWRGVLVTALAAAAVSGTKINPLWLIGAGAVAGIAGLL